MRLSHHSPRAAAALAASAIVLLLVTVGAGAATAQDDSNGWLHLRGAPSGFSGRDGLATAEFMVFDATGQVIGSGEGTGAWSAGSYAAVPEGWYFVDVGRTHHVANARKLFVQAGHVTVVPSGWISLETTEVRRQPDEGCRQWRAELTIHVRDSEGANQQIMSNVGTGVDDFGMVQVPAGDVVIEFNRLTIPLAVEADRLYRIPMGQQPVVAGDWPVIAVAPNEEPTTTRIDLCTNGPTDMPAGTWFVSVRSAIPEYPYTARSWIEIEIPAEGDSGWTDLRFSRLEHDAFTGEGSHWVPFGTEDADALEAIGRRGMPDMGRFRMPGR